ncbi:hypothetical protein TDB9533_02913 [Thalassocella blandensis]|nr:hypothetical protein TDB9533_02913 [Thalassocella blandensis]
MQALVSIHDVSPENFERVSKIIDALPDSCRPNLILLVIPGLQWSRKKIEKLQQLQKSGCILAGHGWVHRCDKIEGVYHKLHSCLVSRNVAEHLALTESQIQQLLDDCYQWFVQHHFTPPQYYVPPAWAMGSISRQALRESPFRYFESSWGIYDAQTDKFTYLPLVGFEADTPTRSLVLSCWNKINEWIGSIKKPLRLSIHPHDPELFLKEKLWQSLNKVESTQHITDLSAFNRQR